MKMKKMKKSKEEIAEAKSELLDLMESMEPDFANVSNARRDLKLAVEWGFSKGLDFSEKGIKRLRASFEKVSNSTGLQIRVATEPQDPANG